MQDGMPLGPIDNGSAHQNQMDINSMLDGAHPELQRDGFTMGNGFGMGDGLDEETAAWLWDGNARGGMGMM